MDRVNRDKTIYKKLLTMFIAGGIFIIINRTSWYITDMISSGNISYLGVMIHHVIQVIFAIGIMLFPIWRKSLSGFGINFKNREKTFLIIKKFTLGWIICTTVFTLITQYISGWPPLINFEMNFQNILSYLFFESVIVGISEEIVFRGLIYGILSTCFNKKITLKGLSISQAGIISALFFALAHIGINFFPFSITFFEPMQVFIAFALGIFYVVVLENTGSLLGPILAHNISDGWLSILYIFIKIFKEL